MSQAYQPPAYAPNAPNDVPLMYAQVNDPATKMQRLKEVATKYELAGGAIAKLRRLERYDIVVIADDSSSMMNPAHEVSAADPFATPKTRWTELCERIVHIIEIATCLDPDGIDIYFLNGEPAMNVTDPNFAKTLFAVQPSGYTPMTACYKRVLNEKVRGGERPVLIIVATDGEPNRQKKNGTWVKDLDGFRKLLMTRDGENPERCPTTIMACTDSEHEMGWLNNLDDDVPNLDVVDDFQAERGEVLAKQGRGFPFSMGDYMVKTMIGPIDPLYDELDEKKLNKRQLAEYLGEPIPESNDCCIIL